MRFILCCFLLTFSLLSAVAQPRISLSITNDHARFIKPNPHLTTGWGPGPGDCSITNGWQDGPGNRDNLRLSYWISNTGDEPLVIGTPTTRPECFQTLDCGARGTVLANCLEVTVEALDGSDTRRWTRCMRQIFDTLSISSNGVPMFTPQGLTNGIGPGCQSYHRAILPFEYFDLTGFPNGIFRLTVKLDPSGGLGIPSDPAVVYLRRDFTDLHFVDPPMAELGARLGKAERLLVESAEMFKKLTKPNLTNP